MNLGEGIPSEDGESEELIGVFAAQGGEFGFRMTGLVSRQCVVWYASLKSTKDG